MDTTALVGGVRRAREFAAMMLSHRVEAPELRAAIPRVNMLLQEAEVFAAHGQWTAAYSRLKDAVIMLAQHVTWTFEIRTTNGAAQRLMRQVHGVAQAMIHMAEGAPYAAMTEDPSLFVSMCPTCTFQIPCTCNRKRK